MNVQTRFLQRYDLGDQELVDTLKGIQIAFGPLICHELIFQIAGQAQRSQLEVIVEPFKKLIVWEPMLVKQWIIGALESPDFPSNKVGNDEKRIWSQKVMR